MNFSTEVNKLFQFSYTVINNNFIKKERDFEQLELDFEHPAKEFVNVENPNCKTDLETRNRELMIKYKYEKITDKELNELHKNLEKLIYQIIHKNFISENFNDVNAEIWQKIAKYKDKWDENKGFYVSTWIAKVAFNVIQTMRRSSIIRKNRYMSVDDLKVKDKKGNEKNIDIEKYLKKQKDNNENQRSLMSKIIEKCMDNLTDIEKSIVSLYLEEDPEKLYLDGEDRIYKRKKATVSFIKKKLNLTTKEYNNHINSIREKYEKTRENTDYESDFGIVSRIL